MATNRDKIRAYVLINLRIGTTTEVLDKLKAVPSVINVASTTGLFDVVVKLEVDHISELETIITEQIHSIDGIVKTETEMIIRELDMDDE